MPTEDKTDNTRKVCIDFVFLLARFVLHCSLVHEIYQFLQTMIPHT